MNPLQQFCLAIEQGDDAAAEAGVSALAPQDQSHLIHLLTTGDGEWRWWATRGLARIGGAEAVRPVSGLLRDPDPGLRAVAALALGHLHTRVPAAVGPALDSLADLLADEEGYVRQAAADGLALCGEAAVPALTVALDSVHEGIRVRAAYALRKVASPQAAGALFRHLNDPNHLVRLYVYETLDGLGLINNLLLTLR